MGDLCVVALIEALEEFFGFRFFQSCATVGECYHDGLWCFVDGEDDFAPVGGVFKGIGEQVGQHLFEVDAVYPCFHHGTVVVKSQVDVSLAGIVLVHRANSPNGFHQVGCLAVELQLVFVDASFVQNLVYQKEQALCVAVDGVYARLAFLIGETFFQLAQRTENERQR